MKTKEKIVIQWNHIPSKPVEEVQFTPQFHIGEKFIAILPKNLRHKKTGVKINVDREVQGDRAWFVVMGTNANNISYEYRYNAGIGTNTRSTPIGKSSIGPWGAKRWVEDYINKNYVLDTEATN